MTHNYKAFQILVESPRQANLNVVLAGGRYDKDLNALFGPQTAMSYNQFFPKVVLLGISGIVAEQGLFCHGNTEEFAVKRDIFKKHCSIRVIVADFTKIGNYDSLCFGRSADMRTNVESCIVVTNKPSKGADRLVKERYSREIESLRHMRIIVDEI